MWRLVLSVSSPAAMQLRDTPRNRTYDAGKNHRHEMTGNIGNIGKGTDILKMLYRMGNEAKHILDGTGWMLCEFGNVP